MPSTPDSTRAGPGGPGVSPSPILRAASGVRRAPYRRSGPSRAGRERPTACRASAEARGPGELRASFPPHLQAQQLRRAVARNEHELRRILGHFKRVDLGPGHGELPLLPLPLGGEFVVRLLGDLARRPRADLGLLPLLEVDAAAHALVGLD